jgi:hypothetical protein
MNQFLAARQADRKVAQVSKGWTNEFIPDLGTLRDVAIELGASKISNVRQKEGKPYISLYTADKKHIDSITFSSALYTKHQAVPYDLVSLLDQPIYGQVATEEATGKVIRKIFIGVTQGSMDDLFDLADLMKSSSNVANAATIPAVVVGP